MSTEQKCSNVFEWIVLSILVLLTIAVVYLIFRWRKTGKFSNCMGKKGAWTKLGKTLVENSIIQMGNNSNPTVNITQSCLDCVTKSAEVRFDPPDFMNALDQKTTGSEDILKNCSCGLPTY